MSLKGQKKKSKSKGIEVNKIYIYTIAVLNVFVAVLLFITKNPKLNNTLHITLQIILISIIFTEIVVVVFSSLLIKEQCFNENKRFNSDSLRICSYCIIPLVLLVFYLNIGRFFLKNFQKYFKINSSFSAIITILLSIYFWFFYLFRCRKAIIEIGSDKYLFYSKAGKPMLAAALIFLSATLFIDSFTSGTISKITISFSEKYNIVISRLLPEKQNIFKLLYRVINLFVNAMYPFIDMYVYVRSEIDEFDKQEQEKREEQEKQKREKLEQEKHEKEKLEEQEKNEKRKQLIKEKRKLLEREKNEELEKQKKEKEKREELEKEKYKYDLYNYD